MLKNLRQWEGGGVAQRRFPAIGIGLHNQLLLLLAIGNLSIGQDFISMYIGVRGVGSGRDAKKTVTVVSTHVLFCFHHLGYFWDAYRQYFDIYVLILRLCMCSSSQFVQQAQSLACAINTHVKLAQLCYFLGCVETRPCVIFGLCSAHSVQSL